VWDNLRVPEVESACGPRSCASFQLNRTIIDLTLRNRHPETKLASLVTIARQFCLPFEPHVLANFRDGPTGEDRNRPLDVPDVANLLASPTDNSGNVFGTLGEAVPLDLKTVSKSMKEYDIHALSLFLKQDRALLLPDLLQARIGVYQSQEVSP
jgi:hypothetical protein